MMKKGDKKRELQQALKELSVEKGYANVTMKDITGQLIITTHNTYMLETIDNNLFSAVELSVFAAFNGAAAFLAYIRP